MHTTWYPATCPTWCTRQHPAILAMADDPSEPTDAAEVVAHSRTLTDPDAAAELSVTLDLHEAHPDSFHTITASPSRLYVWLPEDHDTEGADPDQLRAWAATLTAAADAGEAHLNGAGQ